MYGKIWYNVNYVNFMDNDDDEDGKKVLASVHCSLI